MSNNNETRTNRGPSVQTAACLAFATLLAVGSFAGPATARWDGDNDRHDNRRGEQVEHWDNRNHDYWRAPPVIYERYNAPAYYAPPVVYGPGYGYSFGSGSGLNINIR